jgi:hypothetical protein
MATGTKNGQENMKYLIIIISIALFACNRTEYHFPAEPQTHIASFDLRFNSPDTSIRVFEGVIEGVPFKKQTRTEEINFDLVIPHKVNPYYVNAMVHSKGKFGANLEIRIDGRPVIIRSTEDTANWFPIIADFYIP